jgi:hypothetical protein
MFGLFCTVYSAVPCTVCTVYSAVPCIVLYFLCCSLYYSP